MGVATTQLERVLGQVGDFMTNLKAPSFRMKGVAASASSSDSGFRMYPGPDPERVKRRIEEEKAWKLYDEQMKTKSFTGWEVSRPDFSRSGLDTKAGNNMLRVEEKQLTALQAILTAIKESRAAGGPPGFVYSE
jgi:hypothetical protein